ncbi:MAG: replication-associated recombination protein A [bacterium]|nr:replication-associated recombination protein A [bacterium]
MQQLFPGQEPALKPSQHAPLAAQLAPTSFDAYIGQSHLIGPGKPLRNAIERDTLMSLILWGPPGVGKTALARLMARHSKAVWIPLNAVMSKVQELRDAIKKASENQKMGKKTVLFIDEIHRFNKAQQDALLPDVEKGTVVLIGATTENPFFAVNGSILSRCQVYELYPLSHDEIDALITQSISHPQLAVLRTMPDELRNGVRQHSQGDGRRLVNLLELLATAVRNGQELSDDTLNALLQRKGTLYREDEHYDIISAFIKSVRGSDANAALYWLARMIRGGEDPKFIARRLLILASEDIGNADPNALSVAVNGMQAVQFIGWPEARITLSQVTVYLAEAPKSNREYKAINHALAHVDAGNVQAVPVHLRSQVRPKDPNKSDVAYVYTHDNPNTEQSFWDGDIQFLTP